MAILMQLSLVLAVLFACSIAQSLNGCTENGIKYKIGENVNVKRNDTCETACKCNKNGKVECAVMACMGPPPGQNCTAVKNDTQCCPTYNCTKDCKTCFGKIYRPVCATDRKTYNNSCEIRREVCIANKSIEVVRRGECNTACKTCSGKKYKPVCGTDGKTYSNKCEMRREACIAYKRIRWVHHGGCDTDCNLNLQKCIQRKEKKEKKRRTKRKRVRTLKPVCGQVGKGRNKKYKMYANICEWRHEGCNTKERIRRVHIGNCNRDCISVLQECIKENTSTDPVCGKVGKGWKKFKMYANICEMKREACITKKKIKNVHKGRCNTGKGKGRPAIHTYHGKRWQRRKAGRGRGGKQRKRWQGRKARKGRGRKPWKRHN